MRLSILLLLAGCTFDPANGALQCSRSGECPPGFHCAADRTCWKQGADPILSPADSGTEDLSVASDLAIDAAMPDLAAEAPPDQSLPEDLSAPDLVIPPDLSPTLTLGQACAEGGDCISGVCSDGVCCDVACDSACSSCNQPDSLGTCTPVAAGAAPAHGTCGATAQTSCGHDGYCDGSGACRFWGASVICKASICDPLANRATAESRCDGTGACASPAPIACDPYLCNADNTACYNSCTSVAQCQSPNPCSNSQCGPKSKGTPCGGDGECKSGNCVDGVCCDTPATSCSGCRACNLTASLGTCAPIAAGQDPHGVCAADNTTCTAGGCDGAGACAPARATVTCASSCGGGNQLTFTKCSGSALGCPSSSLTVSCSANLVCADATQCKLSCASDNDCIAGYFCSGGNCVAKKIDGASCAGGNQCTTGNCVDGVCCDSPASSCSGCRACNLAGSVGTCSAIPSGQDPHASCAASTATCTAGGCNGSGACTPSSSSVVCSSSCSGSTLTAAHCSGSGTGCPAPSTGPCANALLCGNATSCKSSCANDGDCAGGFCNADGTCKPTRPNGRVCGGGGDCTSGNCIDGVCCDSGACGGCMACNVAGSAGTCTPVPLGQDPHTSCVANVAACVAGGCNGAGACTPLAAGTICSCSNAATSLCSGSAVGCPVASSQCANFFACAGATSCKTTCGGDNDCIAGYYCTSGSCSAKKSNGVTCASGNECGSGNCVDGVCCNSACNGQCQACDVVAGTCSPVTSGQPHGTRAQCVNAGQACGGSCASGNTSACTFPTTQCRAASCSGTTLTNSASCDGSGSCPSVTTQTCGGHLDCNAGGTACLSTCGSDNDCTSGFYCASGACSAKKLNGVACAAANECGSGNCVDGVCCNSACAGQCQACDVVAGTCSPVTSGQPHGTRSACIGAGTSCGGSCASGNVNACSYPTAQCRAESCSGNTDTQAASCSGGTCPSSTVQACANHLQCGATTCLSTCAGDNDCIGGYFCSAGSCVTKIGPGGTCSTANQCLSGQCVDGVCCNSACGGQCQACDVAGAVGTCTSVTSGQPHGTRAQCTGAGTSPCGGSCSAANNAVCTYPTAQCRAQSCSGNTLTAPASCAAGSCPAPSTSTCGSSLECNAGGTACLSTCASDNDCVSGNYCASGTCTAKKINGTACGAANQCQSSNCVDGVCCNSACGGQCQACDVGGAVGTCSAVTSGQPHGTRTQCTGAGSSPCGGSCAGGNTASCTYPAVSCRSESCSGNTDTQAASCSGGTCPSLTQQACSNHLQCNAGGTTCLASCAGDNDCVGGYYCLGTNCVQKNLNGAACNAADQCQSGFCADGVCCDVACGGQCQACDVGGSVGTCSAVTSGQPHGTRTQCGGAGTSPCGGSCASGNTASCTYPTVSCRAQSCSGTTLTAAASCASGSCPSATTSTCTGHLECNAGGTACLGSCASDNDCVSGYYCASGTCTPKQGDNTACTAANQCSSNACSTFYQDADADGYGNGAVSIKRCGTSAPGGYSAASGDCCDSDNRAHPGQTGWFTSTNNCASWDYDCNNSGDAEYPGSGHCTQTAACSIGGVCDEVAGWQGAVPGCGAGGTYILDCNQSCCSCADSNGQANCAICGQKCGASPHTVAQTQACH